MSLNLKLLVAVTLSHLHHCHLPPQHHQPPHFLQLQLLALLAVIVALVQHSPDCLHQILTDMNQGKGFPWFLLTVSYWLLTLA